MNWEAIGAVGEILAAAAVVVTLILLLVQLRHLAEQTRQNTLAMKFSAYGSHAQSLSDWQRSMAIDEGMSDIFFGCQRADQYGAPSIDEKQWWRYSLAMRSVFVMHEDLYYQHEQGMIDDSYWDQRIQWLAQLIASNPVVDGWWQRERTAAAYVPGFIEAIDNIDITIAGEYLDKTTESG